MSMSNHEHADDNGLSLSNLNKLWLE